MDAKTDKTTITKAFNKHFFEFMDDMLSIYPDNKVLRGGRNSFDTFRRLNPTSIIKVWYTFIYLPYRNEIDQGNMDYFLDKDYSSDLNRAILHNKNKVLDQIDALREPIREMNEVSRQHTMRYLQNLCKLSQAYSSL